MDEITDINFYEIKFNSEFDIKIDIVNNLLKCKILILTPIIDQHNILT